MVEIKINGKHEGYFDSRNDATMYLCTRYYGMPEEAVF